jgi:hypothetical protein
MEPLFSGTYRRICAVKPHSNQFSSPLTLVTQARQRVWPTTRRLASVAFGTLALCLSSPRVASGQSTIKQPGQHPNYSFEAEPHLVIRDGHHEHGSGFGPGFRGTIVIIDNGFVSKINNSVGIGFGLDWLVFGNEHCPGHHPPPDEEHCHDDDAFVLPVVMQWNFWLHRDWSVFGEPGFALVWRDRDDRDDEEDFDFDPFVFYAGGRYHFSDSVTLTMRLGFPIAASIGVSFLL